VVIGSLAAAMGLISLVLATANWYFHRTSSVTDFAIEVPFFVGVGLLMLAVVLLSLFTLSRRGAHQQKPGAPKPGFWSNDKTSMIRRTTSSSPL